MPEKLARISSNWTEAEGTSSAPGRRKNLSAAVRDRKKSSFLGAEEINGPRFQK